MKKKHKIDVGHKAELSKKGKNTIATTVIKQLKTEFSGKGEVRGYQFSQIHKTSRAFIYEVSYGEGKHYEVFKRRVNSRFGCVSYPTSKGFGIWAWTYSTLEKAIKKFNQLEQKINTLKPVEKIYLTREQTMEMCKISSLINLWNWKQCGKLVPKIRDGRKHLYLKQDVIDFLIRKNINK